MQILLQGESGLHRMRKKQPRNQAVSARCFNHIDGLWAGRGKQILQDFRLCAKVGMDGQDPGRPCSRPRYFFRSWLRLPADERDIIAALACREMDGVAHPTLADLSKKFGMTKAGIKYKIARACASIPSFREMFPRMFIQVKNRKN